MKRVMSSIIAGVLMMGLLGGCGEETPQERAKREAAEGHKALEKFFNSLPKELQVLNSPEYFLNNMDGVELGKYYQGHLEEAQRVNDLCLKYKVKETFDAYVTPTQQWGKLLNQCHLSRKELVSRVTPRLPSFQ